jgi:hypothetical protein
LILFAFVENEVLVYRYYFFNRLKQRNPHMKFWELMKWSVRWTFLGPPPESKSLSDRRRRRRRDVVSEEIDTIDRESAGGLSSLRWSILPWVVSNRKSTQRERESSVHRKLEHSSSCADQNQTDECPVNCSSRTLEGGASKPNDVNYLTDDIMGDLAGTQTDDAMEYIYADLLMAYGDYPNTITEDSAMLTAQFPLVVSDDPFSPTSNTPGFHQSSEMAPGSFPSMIDYHDDVYD